MSFVQRSIMQTMYKMSKITRFIALASPQLRGLSIGMSRMITNEAKQSIIGMRVICYKMHLKVGTHTGDVSMFLKYIAMNIKSLYIFCIAPFFHDFLFLKMINYIIIFFIEFCTGINSSYCPLKYKDLVQFEQKHINTTFLLTKYVLNDIQTPINNKSRRLSQGRLDPFL